MIKNKALMWAVVIGAAVIGLTSCKIDMPKETETSFETMTVDTTDIEVPIKYSAKMKGQSDVTIMPQVTGQLMKIYVTEGQHVNRGQTLFVIDSRNAQHELESARANLQAAQANLQAAQAQANSAKLEYESNKNLYEKQIVSNYMLESSLNSYKQAQAAVSQAQASVSQAKTSVNRARVNLGFCTVTSPVSGIIGEIGVHAGNQVNEALADCQVARDKHAYYHRQIEVLHQAYLGTHELMDNGKSNYLEVLTAQETLLNAQLSEAMNMYDGAQAVIALYIALGGGTK